MKESVKVFVSVPSKDEEVELEFERDDEVITIIVDGKAVCSCDWTNNLKEAFKRMLESWK